MIKRWFTRSLDKDLKQALATIEEQGDVIDDQAAIIATLRKELSSLEQAHKLTRTKNLMLQRGIDELHEISNP